MSTTKEKRDYWADLIEALEIMRKHASGPFPTHCEHDQIWVQADPENFTPEEIAKLDELGFIPCDETGESFTSFIFGSA